MKKFKILPLMLIFVLMTAILPVSALAVDDPSIGATAAVLMDATSGEVYYSKNPDKSVHPASTTKMMTALLVVEAIEAGQIQKEDVVTAYSDCQYNMDSESSNANPVIEPGETMTVEQLLYCAMLASANEACNILAEYVSGSISEFVSLMNQRAQELGCTNTNFTNTNGLEDSNHYTTAYDFALIAQEAVQHSLFLQVCGTLNYTVPATNMNDSRSLVNTNNLLNPESSYYYEYAYGIKTGYFSNAGYCLVSAASYDNMDVICVVMGGQETGDQFADTVTLYDWMFKNYSHQQILGSTETIYTVDVALGTTDSTGLRAENAIYDTLPNDSDITFDYQITLYHAIEGRDLEAPVNAGDVLGEVTVIDRDGKVYGTSYLVATNTVEMSRVEYLRTQVKDLFQTPTVRRIITLLIVLLAIYVLLIFFYSLQRARHLKSLRAAKRERALRQAHNEAQWLEIPEEQEHDPDIDYFSDPDDAPDIRRDSSEADQDNYFDSFFKN
jgi:D-alanyl-D-alanine carboxypeptidase (penicillin-binding protein 5/6)